MDHFTPFGARVPAPPVIPVERHSRIPYEWMVAICAASWVIAILVTLNVGVQTYFAVAGLEQQLAWDARR
ncbi:hypothetical protein ASC97_04125 [Rhizobium sp. Root1203]|uniref:hypothetical protein n=1 Tax=Rhizobium sp. Root1203 TaxID=1736427 RepID=UPI00070C2C15|nr:hypothetical protein [Rhizobium sp. Root1203]KQV27574.1 hypothetical protein ASC97_04125 [Rhizobium sp. Root1203]